MQTPIRTMTFSTTLVMTAVLLVLGSAEAHGAIPFLDVVDREVGFVRDGHEGVAYFPVSWKEGIGPAEVVGVRTIEVKRVGSLEEGLARYFRAHLSQAYPALGPVIELRFDLEHVQRPGSYNVALELVGRPSKEANPPGSAPEQDVQLTIVYPAAALAVPAKYVAQRLIGFRSVSGAAPPLVLRESSDLSPVDDLEIQQVSAEGPDGAVTGSLRFQPGESIAPGRWENVPVTLEGDFPPGKSTGSLLVTSPQLTTPIAIPFEVQAKRTPFWIPIFVLLGLAIGFFAKVALPRIIEVGRARAQVDDLAARISQISRTDDVLLEELKRLQGQVEESRKLRDADAIVKRLGEIEGELATALVAHSARLEQVRNDWNDLRRVLARPFTLAPVQSALEVESLSLIPERMDAGDAAGAARALETVQTSLRAKIGDAVNEWRLVVERRLQTLKTRADPLAKKLAASIETRQSSLIQSLRALGSTSVGSLGQRLDEISKCAIDWGYLVEDVIRLVSATVRTCERVLADPDETHGESPELDALREETLWLESLLHGAGRDPGVVFDALLERLDEIEKALRRAILSVSDSKEVVSELEKSDFQKAARAAAKGRTTAEGRDVLLLATKDVDAPFPSENLSTGVLADSTRGLVPRGAAPYAPPLRLDFELRRARTAREIAGAKIAQTVLLVVVLVIGGYFYWEGSFEGTPSDLAQVFFWAFGIDLGVDAVVTLGTQLVARR